MQVQVPYLVVMLSVPRKRRNQSYVIICPSVVFSVQLLSHCFVSPVSMRSTSGQQRGSIPEAGSGTTPIRASAQTDLHFLWGGNLHLLVLRFLHSSCCSVMILRTIWAPVSVNVQSHNSRHQRQSTTAVDFSLVFLTAAQMMLSRVPTTIGRKL